MLNLKTQFTKPQPPMVAPLEVPDTVYLTMVVKSQDLIARVVRAEDALGNRVGAGYINSVRERGGDRHVSVRLIINGLIYTGSMNWDQTRFCKITIANHNLEVIL